MSEKEFLQKLYETGVIPVVRLTDPDQAVPMARALMQGGLPVAEITYRSDAAGESIRRIREGNPGMFVIAGTVLNPDVAEQAVACGAQAIVSPGLNLDTVRWCREHGVHIIPGAVTPTEIEMCMREGLSVVKLFPAEAEGGADLIRSMRGPYPAVRFMPTGGLNPQNLERYLELENVLCCGGTWIVPEQLLLENEYDKIAALAGEAAAVRDRIR